MPLGSLRDLSANVAYNKQLTESSRSKSREGDIEMHTPTFVSPFYDSKGKLGNAHKVR